ncbi:MAG: hypothetical protein K2H92_01150 [Bacteroidaceae bacterium]|nr:hypothetical protein [Bacteroidaceae bacterium]
MSPTSTNRSPRHRLTDVGDSDLEAVKPLHTQECFKAHAQPCYLRIKETFLGRTGVTFLQSSQKP